MYIRWENDEQTITLPINPSEFSLQGTQHNTSLFVQNLGEVNLKGKRNLYTINIDSMFPAQEYDFIHGTFQEPYEIIETIKNLYESNTTVHLVITETDINLFCTIEAFNHGEADRSGDVSYSLSFKEYRDITAANRTVKRVTTKKKQTSYTWKKGDTWPKVVKKVMGNNKTWKTVRKSNTATINKAKKAYKKKHPKVKTVKETVALIGYKVVVK